MHKRLFLAATLAAAGALAGCQTPSPRAPLYTPQQQAKSFGYSEKRVSPGLYEVSYVGPRTRIATWGDPHQADVKAVKMAAGDMARLRAADLALKKGFPAFKIEKFESDATVNRDDYYPWGPTVGFGFGVGHHYGHHGPFTGIGIGFPYGYGPYGYGGGNRSDAKARVKMQVRMLPAPGPDGEDAAKVLQELRGKYASEAAGAGTPGAGTPGNVKPPATPTE